LSKRDFKYDKERDCYYCPQGHPLECVATERSKKQKRYKIADRWLCLSCHYYGQCTTDITGRRVTRLLREELREKLEAQYEAEASLLATC